MGERYKGKGISIEWFGDELAATVDGHDTAAMWAAGQVLKREAMRRAPVGKGTLRDSAYVQTDERSDYKRGKRDRRPLFRKRGKGGVLVGFAAFYANLFEDSGVVAHRMPRKGNRPMAIKGIGVRSRVQHPGMRRRPFLGPALEASKEEMARAFAGVMSEAIEGAMPRAD